MRASIARVLISLLVTLLILSPLLEGIPTGSQQILQIATPLIGLLAAAGGIVTLRLLRAPQRDGRLAQALIGLVSVMVTITLADLVVRFAFPAGMPPRPYDYALHTYSRMPLVTRYAPNTRFEGEIVGDLGRVSGRDDIQIQRHVVFNVDAYGFPNADSRDDDLDLILLGDSFGVGYGTDAPATWGAVLENDFGLNVYNLSISDSTPWQEYTNYLLEGERLGTTSQTVLLWALYSGNDLDGVYLDAFTRDQLPWMNTVQALTVDWTNYSIRSPLRNAIKRLTADPDAAPPLQLVDTHDGSTMLLYPGNKYLTPEEAEQHPNAPLFKRTLEAMIALAQERGVQLVIVVIPSKEELYDASSGNPELLPSGFSRMAQRISEDRGIPFLDLGSAFMSASPYPAEELFWHYDTHWNPAGHRLAAETVMAFLCTPPIQVPEAVCDTR